MSTLASSRGSRFPGRQASRKRRRLRRRGAPLIPLFETLEERRLLASTPEVEPNDTIAQATVLPLVEDPVGSGFLTSNIAVGSINPGNDNDYWSFNAQQNDRLIIDMESPSGMAPRFIVYNAAGQGLLDSSSW